MFFFSKHCIVILHGAEIRQNTLVLSFSEKVRKTESNKRNKVSAGTVYPVYLIQNILMVFIVRANRARSTSLRVTNFNGWELSIQPNLLSHVFPYYLRSKVYHIKDVKNIDLRGIFHKGYTDYETMGTLLIVRACVLYIFKS